jgi:hypothetical protein
MNEDWKMLMPFAAMGKMLDGVLGQVDEIQKLLDFPQTLEAAEIALWEAYIACNEAAENYATAQARCEAVRIHYARMKLAALKAAAEPKPEPDAGPIPPQEATAGTEVQDAVKP